MIELTNLRTPHTKVFELPDGKRQVVMQRDQHYFDRDTGKFEDYRPVIEDDSFVPGFGKRFKGLHWSRFARQGVWRFGFEQGARVTYAPRDAADVEVVASGDTATWSSLWPDVDMCLTVFPEGVKEQLVLRSAAKASFVFDVACDGVSLRQAGAEVEIVDAEEVVVGKIVAPTVMDAAGAVGPATLTVGEGEESDVLTLAVDEVWLGAAERVWPVTVDPTTVIQPDAAAGKDAYVNATDAGDNFGNSDTLYFGRVLDELCHSLIEFAALETLIKPGATVSSATLGIHLKYESENSTDPEESILVSALRVTAAWNESTVTYNNRPSTAEEVTSFSRIIEGSGSLDTWVNLTVTSLVQQWVSQTYDNYGLYFHADPGTSVSYCYVSADSSDSATASYRPKLTIAYSYPDPVPTDPTGTEVAPEELDDLCTPLLQWTWGVTQESYQAQVLDDDNNIVFDSGEVATATAQCEVTGGVEYGALYQWRVRCKAGEGWSDWSDVQWFQCELTTPTGLAASDDSANAEIGLSWTAHTGEDFAGYNLYRRVSATGTWEKVNTDGLITGAAYDDEAVGSGVAYDYKLAAVASDGYESDYSNVVTETVIFEGAWLGGSRVYLRQQPIAWPVRRQSRRMSVNGNWHVQDYGDGAKEMRLSIWFRTEAERSTVENIFANAQQVIAYRDFRGRAMRGYLTSNITSEYVALGVSLGYLNLTLSEARA